MYIQERMKKCSPDTHTLANDSESIIIIHKLREEKEVQYIGWDLAVVVVVHY